MLQRIEPYIQNDGSRLRLYDVISIDMKENNIKPGA